MVPSGSCRLGSVVLVVEAPFPIVVLGHEDLITLTMHDAGLHEVVDEDRCISILLQLVPGHVQLGLLRCKLGLDFVKSGNLRPNLVLLGQVGLLGLDDLDPGPPALRARLQHVDSCTMEYYRRK